MVWPVAFGVSLISIVASWPIRTDWDLGVTAMLLISNLLIVTVAYLASIFLEYISLPAYETLTSQTPAFKLETDNTPTFLLIETLYGLSLIVTVT